MAGAFLLIPTTRSAPLLACLVGLDGVGFAIATTGALAALMERRPQGAGAGPIMGWYTGSTGAGYAVAGFVAGTLADQIGITSAFTVLAGVPFCAGLALRVVLRSTSSSPPQELAPEGSRAAITGRLLAFKSAPALVWLAFFV